MVLELFVKASSTVPSRALDAVSPPFSNEIDRLALPELREEYLEYFPIL